jgi:hypothetical protein
MVMIRKPKKSEKNMSQCHFATNPTYTYSGAKQSIRDERLANNRLNHGTADLSYLITLKYTSTDPFVTNLQLIT